MNKTIKNLSIITAFSNNYVIGLDNKLPWSLPADLKRFKEITTGHPIIMGRKTYESIGRPLPKRTNIVLTSDINYNPHPNVLVCNSIEEIFELINVDCDVEYFVIGGESIYKEFLPYASKLYITEILGVVKGDTYFPKIDFNEWWLADCELYDMDNKNKYNMRFELYTKWD